MWLLSVIILPSLWLRLTSTTSVVYATYLQKKKTHTHFFLLKLFLAVDLLWFYFQFIPKRKIAFNFSETRFHDFLVIQNVLCCINTQLWVIDNIIITSLASCVPLQAPRDGKIKDNDIKHSALVFFSCNDGFQMNGSIILKCIDGKWNGSAPTCKGLRTFPSSVVFTTFISLVCTISSSSSFFLVSNKLIK